MFVISSIE